MTSSHARIRVNRAPVLTLWAAVVAERNRHHAGSRGIAGGTEVEA